MTTFDESADAYKYNELLHARPIEEYDEDMGDVLWWKFPITEAPYVGRPTDLGFSVELALKATLRSDADPAPASNEYRITRMVGGWPGYHTHFTSLPIPKVPGK